MTAALALAGRAFSAQSSSSPALDHSKGRRCSDALSNGRWIAPRQSNRPMTSLVGRLAELSAFAGACSVTNSSRRRDANPYAAHFASKLRLQSFAYLALKHRQPLGNVRLDEKQHAPEDFQIAGNFFQKRARENAC